jgi:hypothetical protein
MYEVAGTASYLENSQHSPLQFQEQEDTGYASKKHQMIQIDQQEQDYRLSGPWT